MNRFFLIMVFLLLVGPGSYAQTDRITRLRHTVSLARNDRELLAANLKLLEEHESLFKDSLMPLALRSYFLAAKTNDELAKGRSLVGMVNAYLRLDAPTRADSVIKKNQSSFSLSDKKLAGIQLQLRLAATNILASRADYEGAVKELFGIIHDAETIGDTSVLARCFNELGVIAYNRDQLDDALNFYRKSLSLGATHNQAEQAKAYSWINIAMVLAWREQFDSALHYINLAKPVCERIDNLYYLANAFVVEANIYKWSKRLPLAERAMLQMVALRERTEGLITFSNEQLGLANFYVYAGACDKAISIYKNGLDYDTRREKEGLPANFEMELRYYEGLAKCYHTTGAKDEYEFALQRIIALKDSLYEKNSAEAIAEMQTKYEVQKKENTIIAQKLDITRKNFLFYGSLLLTILGIIIGWLLFRAYRRKSRLRLYLMQEEEKRNAILAVKDAEEAERKRIAADLHDSLGSYAASIKSHADELKRSHAEADPALDLLQTNARQMVALLSDTIWAMRKESMLLSDISDRVKVVLQRLRINYPGISLRVEEELTEDPKLAPVHAYHMFMIIQEALNNALRHSHGDEILIHFKGGSSWNVSIVDNGTGMSTHEPNTDGGNGLFTMKSRAVSMNCFIKWTSIPPKGTEVMIGPNSN